MHDLVRIWMDVFKVERGEEPAEEDLKLCKNLILEEAREAIFELEVLKSSSDPRPVAKELGDLLWVTLFTMYKLGLPPLKIMRSIYVSNMSKLGDDGWPIIRESDGKILKGPNYKEADLDWLVDEN